MILFNSLRKLWNSSFWIDTFNWYNIEIIFEVFLLDFYASMHFNDFVKQWKLAF